MAKALLHTLLDLPERLAFFKPSSELRGLLLLATVAAGEARSQRALADRVGISVSVANQYLSEFTQHGWVERREVNRRDCAYRITGTGSERANEGLLRYIRETFVLSNHTKQEISAHVRALLGGPGPHRVVIYPAGVVGDLLVRVLGELDVDIVGVVDDDPDKQGSELVGRVIRGADFLATASADAVLVATYRYRDEIVARARKVCPDGMRVICL
jgi:hypothetical protein